MAWGRRARQHLTQKSCCVCAWMRLNIPSQTLPFTFICFSLSLFPSSVFSSRVDIFQESNFYCLILALFFVTLYNFLRSARLLDHGRLFPFSIVDLLCERASIFPSSVFFASSFIVFVFQLYDCYFGFLPVLCCSLHVSLLFPPCALCTQLHNLPAHRHFVHAAMKLIRFTLKDNATKRTECTHTETSYGSWKQRKLCNQTILFPSLVFGLVVVFEGSKS